MFRDFFERRPRIPYFKESVPLPICMGLSFFFALVFQFNAGVFLPTATQMSSMWGWLKEDVQMAAYASFIGMTLIFPDSFPAQVPLSDPFDFTYGLSCLDCLQPDLDADT